MCDEKKECDNNKLTNVPREGEFICSGVWACEVSRLRSGRLAAAACLLLSVLAPRHAKTSRLFFFRWMRTKRR